MKRYIAAFGIIFSIIFIAGCTSSQAPNNTATPAATPTAVPTAAQTPTAQIVPVAMSNANITETFDSGAASSSIRHIRASFNITNDGGTVLKDLVIVCDVSGSIHGPSLMNTTVGTLNPGDTRSLDIEGPLSPATSRVLFSMAAEWDGGTTILYSAVYQPLATTAGGN